VAKERKGKKKKPHLKNVDSGKKLLSWRRPSRAKELEEKGLKKSGASEQQEKRRIANTKKSRNRVKETSNQTPSIDPWNDHSTGNQNADKVKVVDRGYKKPKTQLRSGKKRERYKRGKKRRAEEKTREKCY